MFLLATWLFRSHLVFQDYQTVSISALCWGVSFFVRESVARPFQTPVSAKFHSLAVMEILELMNSDVERWMSEERYHCWIWMLRQFLGTVFLGTWLVVPKVSILVECMLRAQMCWFGISATGIFEFRLSPRSCGLINTCACHDSSCLSYQLVVSKARFSTWSTTIPLRRIVEFHTMKSTSGPDRIW